MTKAKQMELLTMAELESKKADIEVKKQHAALLKAQTRRENAQASIAEAEFKTCCK